MRYYSITIILLLSVLTGCGRNDKIKPQRRDIVDIVFGSGHLERYGQYNIMPNAEGFIKEAYVAEGDTVTNGQVLFRLSNDVQQTQVANAETNLRYAETNAQQGSPQIQQWKIQIAQASQKLHIDSTNYARYSRLVKTGAVSVSDYENVALNYENSRSNLAVLKKNLADLQRNLNLNKDNAVAQLRIQKENNNYFSITSNGNGVVMNLNKKQGDYVRKGDVIAQLGTGNIIIKLDIAENDITRLKTGQRVLISLNSEKEVTYEAHITKIYPAFSTANQSFTAEAMFATTPPELLNGTQLQANIIIQEKKNALVIPSYSLVNGDYVIIGKDKKKVSIGIHTLEWTEIIGGLNEQDVLTLPNRQ